MQGEYNSLKKKHAWIAALLFVVGLYPFYRQPLQRLIDRTPLGPVQHRIEMFVLLWKRGEKQFDAKHVLATMHNGQKIILHKDDHHVCRLIRMHGVWEREQVELLNSIIRPGFRIIECGANYGCHTLFMAQKVGAAGRVIAFEPNPNVYKYLEQSIHMNHLNDRIHLIKKGASDQKGSCTLGYEIENVGGGCIDHATADHTVNIETVRIDDTVPPGARCDLLKMDIEGHEWKAIQGAKRLFQNNPHMLVMMEWSPLSMGPTRSKELVHFMQGHGYKSWRIQNHGYKSWRILRRGIGKRLSLTPVTENELYAVASNFPFQWDIIWCKDSALMKPFEKEEGASP